MKIRGVSYFNIMTKFDEFFTVNLYTRYRYYGDKVYYALMVIAHNARTYEIARGVVIFVIPLYTLLSI